MTFKCFHCLAVLFLTVAQNMLALQTFDIVDATFNIRSLPYNYQLPSVSQPPCKSAPLFGLLNIFTLQNVLHFYPLNFMISNSRMEAMTGIDYETLCVYLLTHSNCSVRFSRFSFSENFARRMNIYLYVKDSSFILYLFG